MIYDKLLLYFKSKYPGTEIKYFSILESDCLVNMRVGKHGLLLIAQYSDGIYLLGRSLKVDLNDPML